ncbi:MAG: class I SAM-dependent methyltransferase [Amaricoccus sp.]
MRYREHRDLWDDAAAASYDTPGIGMFAPEVIGPAVERLATLADGGRAVEFAIGTGRIAVPLRERGIEVAGVEMSPAMLARLREKADAAAIPVVLGDMATARVPGEHSLVYLVFNGISNLLTQGEQVACFRNAARHLRADGRFVIELGVPTMPHPADPQAVVVEASDGYLLVDTVDTVAQIIVSHHFRFGEGDARLFRSPHRYVWPGELDLMGRLAGFELESRWGDWRGAPFDARSRSHVSVYRLA